MILNVDPILVGVIGTIPIIVEEMVDKKNPMFSHDTEAKTAWRCMWEMSLCLPQVFVLTPQLSDAGNDDARCEDIFCGT